jgi:hypothetical protein
MKYQQLTFSPEDSPASPSPTPAKGKRKRTTAGSGPTSPVPFARYDRDSSSWRTYPDSEDEDSTPYSATLPRSGMTRNGIAYQLPPLARPTDGIGSGLWPTPNASVAQDGEGPATWLARRERLKVTANNGNGAGMPLTIAVQLWATPTAHPRTHTPRQVDHGIQLANQVAQWPAPTVKGGYNRKGLSEKSGDGLDTAVKQWPTPTHRDWKSGINHSCWDNARPLSETVGGLLNPPWVEKLMGLPEGWTELPPGKEIHPARRQANRLIESLVSELSETL